MPDTSPHRRRKFLKSGLAALAFSTLAGAFAQAAPVGVYNEQADAAADIAAALEAAKAEGKLVLVVFGANWCPDCRALDGMAREGKLKQVLDDSYVVVHADVGRFNKNLDLAARFGLDVKRGIPAAVVASADKGTRDVADGRTMERLQKGGDEALAAEFRSLAASARN